MSDSSTAVNHTNLVNKLINLSESSDMMITNESKSVEKEFSVNQTEFKDCETSGSLKRKIVDDWQDMNPKKKKQRNSISASKSSSKKGGEIPGGNADYFLLNKQTGNPFPLHGLNPNNITLHLLDNYSYRHRDSSKNLMMIWIKSELSKRCKRLKLCIDRLSSKSFFYAGPVIDKDDHISTDICDDVISKCTLLIDELHKFWTFLVNEFNIACECLKYIVESKCNNVVIPNAVKECIYFSVLEECFGRLWSTPMHECSRIDLLIISKSMSRFFDTPTHMMETLLGFDKKYPFFHQQEGVVHFFWSILRPSLMMDKNTFFMDHMGTGKTFQAIINMRSYQILFGWLSSVVVLQSFNIGLPGSFVARDRCLFDTDASNEYNVWCNYVYTCFSDPHDVEKTKKEYIAPAPEFFVKDDTLRSFVTTLFSSRNLETPLTQNSSSSTSVVTTTIGKQQQVFVNNPDTPLSTFILSEIEKEFHGPTNSLHKDHIALYERYKEIFSNGINLNKTTQLGTMLGENISLPDDFVISELPTSKVFCDNIPDVSDNHEDLLKVIFKDAQSQTPPGDIFIDSNSAKSTKPGVYNTQAFGEDLMVKLMSQKSMPYIDVIKHVTSHPDYMSLAGLENSDFCAVNLPLRTAVVETLEKTITKDNKDNICDRIALWMKCLLSAKTKMWDFFFCPKEFVNLPPLIVIPKGSVTVWLEEFYKSIDSAEVAIINNALKEEIYGIIRKETNLTNHEIEFSGKTIIGEKENWYASARLVYSYPSTLEQMTPYYDFALIHIDGLETENKAIKSYISGLNIETSKIIGRLEKISNVEFKQLAFKCMTFFVYIREVHFFISVQENIKKLKQRDEWKSYTRLHKYLKLVLDGCKKYLSTYNTPGFFLNILRKTFSKDWDYLMANVQKKFTKTKGNATIIVSSDIEEIIRDIRMLNARVVKMDGNLPAFTAYVMNTSYCLNMDESHTIRNINQTWDTFVSIPTDIRSFLTGTPLNNNESKELINIIKMVNKFGPFNRTLELSHVNIYGKSAHFSSMHEMLLDTYRSFHTESSVECNVLYSIYKSLPQTHFYRRHYPFLFLGDRVTRSIPHNTKWTSFSEHLGNMDIFHQCRKHKTHNALDRKQLWKNIESYQSRASSSTTTSETGYSGDIKHFFKPIQPVQQRTSDNRNSNCGQEKFNTQDIWSDNARAHIVDVMGRRITMNSPWNMGGVPLSLVYAHNNLQAKASTCKTCGACARPFSEYKDVIEKFNDDINNISGDDMDVSDSGPYGKDELNDTKEYEDFLLKKPRFFDNKQVFGIMKNKNPYNPQNFSFGTMDNLYKYEYIMISNNIRSLWFNPAITLHTPDAKKTGSYLPVVINSESQQTKTSLGDIAVKYGVGSMRYKKALEKANSGNQSTTTNKGKQKGKPKKNPKVVSDEKPFTDKLRRLLADVENRHSIRNDMQTSALCECFSTLDTEVQKNVDEVSSCIKNVYIQTIHGTSTGDVPVTSQPGVPTVTDFREDAKLLMFMINYSGMRFQNSFGGCIRHNPYTLHSDSLLSDDIANAVDDLQLISMSLVDSDFKDMLLYRFIQSSVVLFTKFKKHMSRQNKDNSHQLLLNMEDFHVWYYLHSGESIKDSNMYKSDAKSVQDILQSLFGIEAKRQASSSKSWYSDKFILHDEDEWFSESSISDKNSLEIETLDGDDIKQISVLVSKLIETHRSKMCLKIPKHLPKYSYHSYNSSTVRSSNGKDFWHENTCIFWGKFIPKPVIYKVCMSSEELEVYKYYIYGENMKKQDNQLLKELTLAANGKINHELVKKANKLLFSTTKNAMICCENYFQKMPRRYSTFTNIILEQMDENDNDKREKKSHSSEQSSHDVTSESSQSSEEDSESDNDDDETSTNKKEPKQTTKQLTNKDEKKKLAIAKKKNAAGNTNGKANHKRDLYSQKLLDVFKTFNYNGKNILHPSYGFFDPSKMPSKYHGIVAYILSRTNICQLPPTSDESTKVVDTANTHLKPLTNLQPMPTTDNRDFLIIYVQTVKYVDHLASYIMKLLGIKCSIYVGSGSVRKNAKFYELKTFQDGGTRILIASLKIAGASLNIPRANHVLFTLAWWNPQLEEQAKARIIRANQLKDVNFGIIVMNNALDEIIIDTGDKKGKGISGIFKNSSGIVRADASKYIYIHVDRQLLTKAFTKHFPTLNIAKNIKIMEQAITQKFVDSPDISTQEFNKEILSSIDNNGNLNPLTLFKSPLNRANQNVYPLQQLKSSSTSTTQSQKNTHADGQINTSIRIARFLEATKRLQGIIPTSN